MQPSELTREDRYISGIAHIAVLFSALGLALNIALLVHFRGRSRFIVDHLKQALGLQVISIILSWTASLYVALSGLAFTFGQFHPHFFMRTMLLGLVLLALNLIKIVLALLGAIRGVEGRPYRQPLLGEFLAQIGW